MKYFSLLFLIVAYSFSCSTDDAIATTQDALLIKTIQLNNQVIESFVYDNSKRLITRIGNFSLGAKRIEIEYQDNLKKYTYYTDQDQKVKAVHNYTAQDIQIRQDDIDVQTGEILGYRLYNTNTSTCNLDSILYYNNDAVLYQTIAFSYTDANCSTTVVFTDSTPGNRASNTTINDAKNRSTKALDYPFYNSAFSHNRLSYTNYTDTNQVIAETSYTNVFTYNEFDYPVTETRTYLDGSVENYTYEYY